jgi:hypothetical protein
MSSQDSSARFDANFCGKVVRVAAAVSVIEFLLAIILLVTWVPADSKCRAWSAPRGSFDAIYPIIVVVGLMVLSICVLAISWKHIVNAARAQTQWDERQRQSTGTKTNHTTSLSVVFAGLVAAASIPLIVLVTKCGP